MIFKSIWAEVPIAMGMAIRRICGKIAPSVKSLVLLNLRGLGGERGCGGLPE
jgi:hypothetical protein